MCVGLPVWRGSIVTVCVLIDIEPDFVFCVITVQHVSAYTVVRAIPPVNGR